MIFYLLIMDSTITLMKVFQLASSALSKVHRCSDVSQLPTRSGYFATNGISSMYMDCPDQAEFGIRGLARTQVDPGIVHAKLSPTGYVECEL